MRYGRELEGYPFNLKALITRGIIYTQRKAFGSRQNNAYSRTPVMHSGADACEQIHRLLTRQEPCMITRFGTNELDAVSRYMDINAPGNAFVKFCKLLSGKSVPFWWDNSVRGGLCWNAGYFPPDNASMNAFGKRYLQDCEGVDILGSFAHGDERIVKQLCPNAVVIPLGDFGPLIADDPWTPVLEGKKVLVIYPFVETIKQQYARRQLLFANPNMCPEFILKTYKPVVSLAGERPPFATWIEALDHMCAEIRGIDFDIALIGAGAYSLSLAADIKRSGRKAIHLGGATQLLFGIKGGRWDAWPKYTRLYNKYWVRPFPEEVPAKAKTVESSAYW